MTRDGGREGEAESVGKGRRMCVGSERVRRSQSASQSKVQSASGSAGKKPSLNNQSSKYSKYSEQYSTVQYFIGQQLSYSGGMQ